MTLRATRVRRRAGALLAWSVWAAAGTAKLAAQEIGPTAYEHLA